MNFLYPTDIFPFTDVEHIDPETGLTDGLLSHQGAEFLPKIFYSNSSYALAHSRSSQAARSVAGFVRARANKASSLEGVME